jgi:hypothetical protein
MPSSHGSNPCAGKFGGLFASMPQAMVSGLFCVMFSLIAAVGISQMQFADMNSPRNIFILGAEHSMYVFMFVHTTMRLVSRCDEHPFPPRGWGGGGNIFILDAERCADFACLKEVGGVSTPLKCSL